MDAEKLNDHDFAAAVRGLTKAETNEEALEVLRVADELLEMYQAAAKDLPEDEEGAPLPEGTRVDLSRLPE